MHTRSIALVLALCACACSSASEPGEPSDATLPSEAAADAGAEAPDARAPFPPGPCCVSDPELNELLRQEGVLCCDGGAT